MKARIVSVGLLIVIICTCFATVQAKNPSVKPLKITAVTTDTTTLSADLYVPADTGRTTFPLVILLHMMNHDRASYRELVPLLLSRKWAVLNVDLRGHGKSNVVRGAKRTPEQLLESDFPRMPGDLNVLVAESLKRSAQIDTQRVAIVGASIGSSVAVFYGAEHPTAKAIVLLSPGLNYRNMELRPRLMLYGRRPILMLVGKKDQRSFESCILLNKVALGDKKLVVYDVDAHGTDIFPAVKGADSLVINWLGPRMY